MALTLPVRSSSRVAVTVRGRSWRGGSSSGGLAGEPADDLGAAAGLAEGPLDEVSDPDVTVTRARNAAVRETRH